MTMHGSGSGSGSGVFTVSLDFEMAWGVHDLPRLDAYLPNLEGTRVAVHAIHDCFERRGIHATWATVGLLFCEDAPDRSLRRPRPAPEYDRTHLDPYENDAVRGLDEGLLTARDLIERISKSSIQEIGSHTFSHFCCLEAGQSIEAFEADLKAAVLVAQDLGIQMKSLVFPRNQFDGAHLDVLSRHNFVAFRGNEPGHQYDANARSVRKKLPARLFRLLDAYVDLSGSRSHALSDLAGSGLVDVPGSRFLRPRTTWTAPLDSLLLRRLRKEIVSAARQGRLFHLWFHPHNFGVLLDRNMAFLERVLDIYDEMRVTHEMRSLNMTEFALERLRDRGGVVDRSSPNVAVARS